MGLLQKQNLVAIEKNYFFRFLSKPTKTHWDGHGHWGSSRGFCLEVEIFGQ